MLAVITLLLLADAPPPPPTPTQPVLAWACDRQTLLAGLPCTFEGKSRAQEPSTLQAEENQRQARVLGLELCASAASGRQPQPTAAVKAACEKRLNAALTECGGDGARRVLDDDGHFNPGHAGCYAALRAVTAAAQRSWSEANSCCACLDDRRGAAFDQCVAAADDDRVPAGADRACRSSCASILLRAPAALAPRRP